MSSACVCHIDPNECEWCLTGMETVSQVNVKRLNEIKEIRKIDYSKRHDSFLINLGIGNVNFLIEQAERAQELKNKFSNLQELNHHLIFGINEPLAKENRRLREAICKAIAHFRQDEHPEGMRLLEQALEVSK